MDLFHFREESPGAVFWHEKGWLLFQRLVEYMRAKQRLAGYKEINTPELDTQPSQIVTIFILDFSI